MLIGDRIREIRESKNLSQGDVEERTGLKRCYVSRVENGHTVPSLETLEKLARALEVPLYQLVYSGNSEEDVIELGAARNLWGSSGKQGRYLNRLRQLLSRMTAEQRELVLFFLEKLLQKRKRKAQC